MPTQRLSHVWCLSFTKRLFSRAMWGGGRGDWTGGREGLPCTARARLFRQKGRKISLENGLHNEKGRYCDRGRECQRERERRGREPALQRCIHCLDPKGARARARARCTCSANTSADWVLPWSFPSLHNLMIRNSHVDHIDPQFHFLRSPFGGRNDERS